jgi:outer membrane protein OmpA-like peptidoglycan-associated protein
MKALGFILILSLLVLYMPYTGRGQHVIRYRISGTITDALNHHPVKATVIFQALPEMSEVYIDDTHETSGLYSIGVHNENRYLVEVSAPYYKPEIDTLFIADNMDSINYELLSVRPGSVLRLQKIYFEQGDYHIQPGSIAELSELILLMERYPDMIIRLEGHTDRLGGRQANMILSQNRVEEIKNYLIRKGVDQKRIKTQAFGGNRPISTENDEESRKLNRRVEVRILTI